MPVNNFTPKVYSIALLLFVFCATSCNKTQEATPPPKTYPIVAATVMDIKDYYVFPAQIIGKNDIQIHSKVQGYIQSLLVKDGQKVVVGQPILKIETKIQERNADAAKSQISASNANIKAAEASVDAANVEVSKLIPLVEKGIISNIQLETAKANLARAKSQVSQATAGREVAQANYKEVLERIGFSVIKSPINGVLGKFNVREGALVSPSDPNPITTVVDISKVYAYFSINEGDYINFFQTFSGKNLEEKLALLPPAELSLANESTYDEKG